MTEVNNNESSNGIVFFQSKKEGGAYWPLIFLGTKLGGTSLGGSKPIASGTSLGGTSLGGTSLGGKLNFVNSTTKEATPEQKPTPSLTKKNISNITQQSQKVAGQTSYVIKAHRDTDLDHVSSDEEEDEKVRDVILDFQGIFD